MTSLTNRYFKKQSSVEQKLFNRLKTEAIQVMGRTLYYLPRNVQVEDLILGEDVLSKFEVAVPIEMYMENALQFDGDREIFSKFGIEVHNSYKLVVSQDRWVKEVGSVHGSIMKISNRPQEGDLIYDPLTKFLMEIKFVDHDAEFYQLGKNYLWHLSCESFQYNSETFTTGIQDIDDIDLGNTFDLLGFQITKEDGGLLLQENCDSLLHEEQDVTTDSTMEYGTDYKPEAEEINWSVDNPFSGL